MQTVNSTIEELEKENSELKKKLEFYESFNEYLSCPEMFLNADGELVFVSKDFEAISGYNRRDILNTKTSFINFVHPDDISFVLDKLQKQLNKEKIQEFTLRIFDVDKNTKYISINSTPVFSSKGEFLGSRISWNNDTQFKENEKALKIKELKLQTFVQKAFEGIIIINSEGSILEWNNQMEKISGIAKENAIGQAIWKLQYELATDEIKKKYTEEGVESIWMNRIFNLPASDYLSEIGQVQNLNGEIKYVEDLVSPVFFENEKYYIIFQREITERKKAEQALKASQFTLRIIENNIPASVTIVNFQFEYIYMNNWAEKHFGLLRKDILGKKVKDVIGEEAFERAYPYAMQAFAGKTVSFENQIEFWEGEPVILQNTFVPYYENDQIAGIVIMAIDITARRNAEKALSKSETKYRLLFENLPQGFSLHQVILDENKEPVDFRFLEANNYYEAFTGFKPADIIGKTVKEVKPSSDKAMIKKFIDVAITGIPFKLEYYSTTFNKWTKVNCYCPQKGQFASIFEDITERKNIELALKESEELLNETQKLAGIAGWSFDVESEKTSFTKQMFEIYGKEITNSEELVQSFIGKDKEIVQHAFKEALTLQKEYDLQLQLKNASGEKLWVRTTGKPIVENGKLIKIIGNLMDITIQKNAELELEANEKQLRLITDHLPVLINRTNSDLKFLFANQYYYDVFGITKHDIIGKKIVDVIGIKSFEKSLPMFKKVLAGEIVRFENQLIDKNKQERMMQITFVPEFENEQVIGFYSLLIDITERIKNEFIIQQQNTELIKLNADKDRFISILAHDLKNPFTSILGFLNLLTKNIRKYDIEKIESQIQLISESTHNVFKLLQDILVWASAQRGELPFKPANLNFNLLCNEVILNLKPTADLKEITINNYLSEDLEIFADSNMLSSVMRNLLSNALKFTNRCGIISISSEKTEDSDQGKPGNFHLIKVSDTGTGILPETIPLLFDLTQKISTKGTEHEIGTGLGLLLCKEFVEKHGGKIWVESELDNGSDFKFTVPLIN